MRFFPSDFPLFKLYQAAAGGSLTAIYRLSLGLSVANLRKN